MNRKALLELADFLEILDPKRFDICTWRMLSKGKPGFVSDEQLLNDQKTLACPVGWGCLLDSWRQTGLYIAPFSVKEEHLSNPLSKPHVMSLVKTKLDDELDSYEAIDLSLSLYPGTAAVLFNPDNYADEEYTDAKTVAERIREFCLVSEEDIANTVLSYSDSD